MQVFFLQQAAKPVLTKEERERVKADMKARREEERLKKEQEKQLREQEKKCVYADTNPVTSCECHLGIDK